VCLLPRDSAFHATANTGESVLACGAKATGDAELN
jgi:hypothetical protein